MVNIKEWLSFIWAMIIEALKTPEQRLDDLCDEIIAWRLENPTGPIPSQMQEDYCRMAGTVTQSGWITSYSIPVERLDDKAIPHGLKAYFDEDAPWPILIVKPR